MLSNLPIYAGDNCIMLVIDEGEYKVHNKYFIDTAIGSRGMDSEWRMFKSFHRGPYNDYGWIEGVEQPDNCPPCIFCHEAAWEWALKNAPPDSKHMFAETKSLKEWYEESHPERLPMLLNVTPWLIDLYRVCNVARLLRRDILSGLKFRGMQEWALPVNYCYPKGQSASHSGPSD